MTLIAGILALNDRPLADSGCASLRQAISRNPADEVTIFRDHRSCFAKVDIGVFGEPGVIQDESGALSLLAGEPLLNSHEIAANRFQDLRAIHEQCLKSNLDILREAEGTFSVVHYQPQTGTLFLVADKLGIRPMYFWMDDDLFVFASALRILEQLSFVPKQMDLRAVTEIVALGAPLADRTPYAGICLLKAAEVVTVTKEELARSYYWRWDDIATESDPEPLRLATVYDRFQSAIRRRNRDDKTTAAFLSGGLDSRCIVAALCHADVQTRTVNFARPGTQDYYFGNEFAAKTGSVHESIPKEKGDSIPDYSALMAKTLARSSDQWPAQRPRLVWSGEGGSMLLGHVHLSESLIGLMRAGKADRAIEEYMQREQIDLPLRLFRPQILDKVRDVIRQGVREELHQLRAEDAGRNLYLFLVLNDQRRKLTSHFENIDLHRLEFQLPFFDAGFLQSVMATPLDWCLKHRFYGKWLGLFPAAVTSVPWQAYPGHEPCPLTIPEEFAYQWDSSYQRKEDESQDRRLIERGSEILRSADFPDQILSKRNLRLATWIHSRGWRNYRYAIEAAQTYYAYSKKCGGEIAFSQR